MNEFNDQQDQFGNSGDHGATFDKDTKQWAMMLHLSQFAGFAAPVAGFIAPILIWQLKKDELPGLDEHGRIVVNWVISELIYGLIAFLLAVTLVGIPIAILLAAVVGLLGLVFPIVGAIKASDGIAWRYPMSFRLF